MRESSSALQPFVKLASPVDYIACNWNLTVDAEGRQHWVEFFKRHLETILKLGIAAGLARGIAIDHLQRQASACRDEFIARFDSVHSRPQGMVTILTLDMWRDQILRKHGFVDAFVDLKDRENEKALPLLATVCRQIDELKGAEQLRAIIEGVFAGNIFDMGAEATAKAYLNSGPDFFATRKTLAPRPWLVDDYDALAHRLLQGSPHAHAIYFIDNAGSDFILGAIPLIRWLALRGTRVTIAANERPTLNDMTVHDVRKWWPRVLQANPSLGPLPIDLVSTGTGEPLIDLSLVSDELNVASADADLIILEGMGRGVESNLDARFTCDAMNLAMIKDTAVARRNGGKLFDIVCRFASVG